MFSKKRGPAFLISVILLFSFVGIFLSRTVLADFQDTAKRQIKKFISVVQLVQLYYVEDVSWDDAIAGGISGMLSKLDPHSVYIPPKRVKQNKENFSGKYQGIGIQFDVIDGYLTVIAPIAGSPSDKLGILSGDQIIKIDGKSAIGISREEVPKKLKGPKGTTVKVTIRREGVDEPLEFTIVRDVIPITTITAQFMEDDSTGYISINRFAATTSRELEKSLEDLEAQRMKRLVLDLRGNPGGYLHEAVKVAGKFLPGNELIVYTKGRSGKVDEKYYPDQFGPTKVRDFPLIVLIDNGSASASEIVSGAIQDYDRGLIVGRNSFGKGLVQKEFSLRDGSAVRITTAKYYTPSGRSIQRNYKGLKLNEYYEESHDSTLNSEKELEKRPVFYTRSGRKVYGAGGIHPDVVVPYHSGPKSAKLVGKILQKRLFFEYAKEFINTYKIPKNLKKFVSSFHLNKAQFKAFREYLKKHKIDFKPSEFQKDRTYFRMRIEAEIARKFWDSKGFYYVLLNHDNQFRKALTLFPQAGKLASLNN